MAQPPADAAQPTPQTLMRLTRGLTIVSTVALWAAGIGLVAMTAAIGWQIYGRYMLNDTPHWTERFSTFIMVYYILFAAAVGVRERVHIGLVFLRDRLPRRGRLAVEIATNALIVGFGLTLAWYGGVLTEARWNQTIPTLGLPTGMSYLPFPVAGVLMAVFSLENILHAVMGEEGKRGWN